ncbi:hypothetical protein KCU95_g3152, partial [Aureobasidium melanogenum]
MQPKDAVDSEEAYYIHPENKRVCFPENDEAAFLESVYDQLDILYDIGPGRERVSRAHPTRKDISDAVVAETGLPSVGHTMTKKLSSMLRGLARPQLPELLRTTCNMTVQNNINISSSDSDVQSDDAVAPGIYENPSANSTSIADTDNPSVPGAHADDSVVAVSPGRAASQEHTTKNIPPRTPESLIKPASQAISADILAVQSRSHVYVIMFSSRHYQ